MERSSKKKRLLEKTYVWQFCIGHERFFSTFYLQSLPCLENTGLFDPLLLGNSQMEAWKKKQCSNAVCIVEKAGYVYSMFTLLT